jgi:hypothetical protein
MNGISREKNLPDSWKPGGETQVWRNEELAAVVRSRVPASIRVGRTRRLFGGRIT